jgi:hypothetical protein
MTNNTYIDGQIAASGCLPKSFTLHRGDKVAVYEIDPDTGRALRPGAGGTVEVTRTELILNLLSVTGETYQIKIRR